MKKPMSTNDVRRVLERHGVEKPSRRAVAMIAQPIHQSEGATYWTMAVHETLVAQAIKVSRDHSGEASYEAFRKELRRLLS